MTLAPRADMIFFMNYSNKGTKSMTFNKLIEIIDNNNDVVFTSYRHYGYFVKTRYGEIKYWDDIMGFDKIVFYVEDFKKSDWYIVDKNDIPSGLNKWFD